MKRLLALSLLAATVAVPAAAAKTTITVATASALAHGADPITITRTFHTVPGTSTLPREMYVVSSGPVGGVSTKVSCYPSVNSYWPNVNRGSASGPGRLGLMYDQGSNYCTVTTSASEAYHKHGTIKIALQIVP
jgi:hypothetical protein